MKTSETITELAQALNNFHKEVKNIKKGSINPFFKSKYADLSTILEGVDEPLNKNGLMIIQLPEGSYGLCTRLLHISGEWIEESYILQPVKNSPQDAGSVITYQRRYALGAILSLNIDEDDDGEKAMNRDKKTDYKPVPKTEIKQAASLTDELRNKKRQLSPIGFQKVLDRIKNEDYSVFQITIDTYIITEDQKAIMQRTVDETIVKNQGNEITIEQKEILESDDLEKEIISQENPEDLPF